MDGELYEGYNPEEVDGDIKLLGVTSMIPYSLMSALCWQWWSDCVREIRNLMGNVNQTLGALFNLKLLPIN